jgi:Zn-dependent peptidase ImmA (M78 family)
LAKNLILSPKTAADIDRRVDRVLQGLGNPEPPLRLELVRELLKLDVGFYTADNPGMAREVVSRIRVATIQVFQRPTLLLDAIKKMSLKALYLPDRKRILLDGSLPALKHRWNEAHEVGHSLLPWHEAMMHGDNDHTLSRNCHEHVEAEANFAAGRLLFLRDRFANEARALSPTFGTIDQLRKTFGNTLSTTLYRFVEAVGDENPVVGMITCHPHPDRRPFDHDPANPCKHVIQSTAFQARFARVTEVDLFGVLVRYCASKRGGVIGQTELILSDDNGDPHRFYFETFYNRYDALTLGVYVGPERVAVAVGL